MKKLLISLSILLGFTIFTETMYGQKCADKHTEAMIIKTMNNGYSSAEFGLVETNYSVIEQRLIKAQGVRYFKTDSVKKTILVEFNPTVLSVEKLQILLTENILKEKK
ncbi:MAG TPA: hypothetical protein DCQ31_02290 [Bacteroidales bacterium]|nr:hypothetical protein [Bacteroidales bacterium]